MIDISIQESLSFEGNDVVLLRIINSQGAYVELTNLGASVVSVVVPDKDGAMANVALRYDSLSDYFADPFYLGATIGRYANRISNATFTLDGNTYNLDRNDGRNSNHGGNNGFNKKIFDYSIDSQSVVFYIESPDGEGGFPGHLKLWVTYSFTENNELRIAYRSSSDKRTPVNFTNHTYFNLSATNGNALNHELLVNAEYNLGMDNAFLPTGKRLSVASTAFDFRDYRVIEQMMPFKNDNLRGYNAFFIGMSDCKDKPVASLRDPYSGRRLDVYNTMAGLQFYTGDFLSDKFIPYQGVCLEAHYHPDGVNHSGFDVCLLNPGEERADEIRFCFLADR